MEVHPFLIAVFLPIIGVGLYGLYKYIEDWNMTREIKAEKEAYKKLRADILHVVNPLLHKIECSIVDVDAKVEKLEVEVNHVEAAFRSRMESQYAIMENRMCQLWDNCLNLDMKSGEMRAMNRQTAKCKDKKKRNK